ncbi:hypothetical protein D7030_08235 [Flavobacteriaceae bacterium AU392]|nr:hypothetical protein D1817_00180 [Flavobacteriaceae bacterium]RKM85110.1 hypothetical protein D7030_08235 [Flavobacteriaceae bacterium AU392]
MRNLQNLKGAHSLSKNEQKEIKGGLFIGGTGNTNDECNNNCDCFHSHGPSNLSFGFVCANIGGSNRCVEGIYFEPPCG